jgi:type IV pilus assembly protein PilE
METAPMSVPGGKQTQCGVTLIEILVVVALLAVLLRLAVPSYQQYLQRGHRVEAARALYTVAACQERVRAHRGQYDTTRCTDDADTEHYQLMVTPPGQTSVAFYTAIAVPKEPAAGDPCGSLALDQSGARRISGDPARTAACWSGR